MVSYQNVKKVGLVLRGLSIFILICGVLSGAGLIYAIVAEPFQYLVLVMLVVTGVTVHVFGTIGLTGYAPKYLLFAHDRKDIDY